MADFFKIYSTNLVNSSTITATNENAQFPSSNLKDYRRSKVFRSTTNSDTIVFDFGSAQSIDSVFILADKRAGFGLLTATVQFNSTNVWTSPAFSTTVSLSTSLKIGLSTFTLISYRYARIVMTSSLGYCELSKIFIGAGIALNNQINFGWTVKDEDISTKSYNRYGQQFSDIILRQKKISFSFKYINKDNLDLINLALDASGETTPVWIWIGDASMSVDYRRNAGAYFIDDIPTVNNTHFNKYSLSFSLKEAT